jgi:uncharacterized protein (DUF885 family)
MKFCYFLLAILCWFTSYSQAKTGNAQLAGLFKEYTEEVYRLNPLTATMNGDYRYNDRLPVTFTDSYNDSTARVFKRFLSRLKQFNRASLDANDRISYDIFQRDLETALEGMTLKTNRIPFSQFTGLHQTLALLGSGSGQQPFKTVKDYEDWLSRAGQFAAWSDSAIVYFRNGMAEKMVLPKALVIKLVPQLRSLQVADPAASVFYGPVKNFPAGFSEGDKARLADAYKKLITETINPAYNKLEQFISTEYLPASRTSSGLTGMPNGKKLYDYAIRAYTTTNMKPEVIYNIGLAEVKRIRSEMEKVKRQVGFKGTLDSFFFYTKNDPKFLPYKTPEEVLEAYRAIQQKIEPFLPALFGHQPKTPFEVRQTEAFRAASAAAQYFAGLPDGSRPGIFYVPIVDATKYTTAKENLFIHEAIPGHHFQIMIQRENTALPAFRQNGGNSAFAEGWGLYAESLGKLLGCYTDPYQLFYALGDEMHRAIRLVVDAGMHAKGWTREQAIAYMRANEPITEQSATAEIERYMAIPGQALSYKIGELKIKELRAKYQKQLGTRFSLAAFHDELLKDGMMPLVVLENKLDAWAASQKTKTF